MLGESESMTLGDAFKAGETTFDASDPNFRLYNVCKVITTEQWEIIGLTPVEDKPYTEKTGGVLCLFNTIDQSPGGLVGVAMSKHLLKEEQLDESSNSDASLPKPDGSAFFKYDDPDAEHVCHIGIETLGGSLSFIAYPETGKRKDGCRLASSLLQTFLDQPVEVTKIEQP